MNMPDSLTQYTKRHIADCMKAHLPEDKFDIVTWDFATNTGVFVVLDSPACDYMFQRFLVRWNCDVDIQDGFRGSLKFVELSVERSKPVDITWDRRHSFGESLQELEVLITQWKDANDEE